MRLRRVILIVVVLLLAATLAVGVVLWLRHRAAGGGAGAPVAVAPAGGAEDSGPRPAGVTHLSHGRFQDVTVYAPAGTPTSFVLYLSGTDGWRGALPERATALAHRGALVAGIDLPQLERDLDADGGDCVFPDGDLENLSHFVQAYYRLPVYLSPILVGTGEGAAFAYAMLAQAPANTFAGALSEDFCPSLVLAKPLCRGSGVESHPRAGGGALLAPAKHLQGAWSVLAGVAGSACPAVTVRAFVAAHPEAVLRAPPAVGEDPQAGFFAAFDALAARARPAAPAAPAALGDLPVIEVPAAPGAPNDLFAIILSGDGGWAGLDKDVAAALAAKGIPVVGLDSLRYFWSPRTPEGLARDLDRLIRFYRPRLGKSRVLLAGYSQGADVLPFAINRLAPDTRAAVALAAVMGLSEHAVFEFHVANWISDDRSGPATLPEISRINDVPVLCIYGKDEDDTVCPKLDASKIRVVRMPGGHHFDGDYAGLAQQILNQIPTTRP